MRHRESERAQAVAARLGRLSPGLRGPTQGASWPFKRGAAGRGEVSGIRVTVQPLLVLVLLHTVHLAIVSQTPVPCLHQCILEGTFVPVREDADRLPYESTNPEARDPLVVVISGGGAAHRQVISAEDVKTLGHQKEPQGRTEPQCLCCRGPQAPGKPPRLSLPTKARSGPTLGSLSPPYSKHASHSLSCQLLLIR